MMNSQDTTFTENDMKTRKDSGSSLVDMFYSMGAARNKEDQSIIDMFQSAYNEMPIETMKALFYNRDIRGGQGERRFFRTAYRHIAQTDPEVARKNLDHIPEYGRWDDVLEVSKNTPIEEDALDLYEKALLEDEDGLAAKWAPREGKSDHDLFEKLREHMGLSHRQYRKLVGSLSDTVEDKMCRNDWENINYSSVPSQAINKYKSAFHRNDEERFVSWTNELMSDNSDANISAGAIYPHQIVRQLLRQYDISKNDIKVLEAQWDALPEYMPEGKKVIPVCDTSGSMNTGDGQPMEVSVALGIYTAERNNGPYANSVITFSEEPNFINFGYENGLRGKANLIRSDSNWGQNTDIEKTFDLILEQAVQNDLDSDEMPDTVIIFSDMQFDQATGNYHGESNPVAMDMIEQKYDAAGYDRPDIVYWNLRDSNGKPVEFTKNGTALVSGFSPSILKMVLSAEEINPLTIVMDTINSNRYEPIGI